MAVNIVAPSNRADAGDEPHPVVKKNEQEEGDEQRKCSWKSFLADDGLENFP